MTATLRALAEQATPGPWGHEPPSRERATVHHIIRENLTGPQVANVLLDEDAAYIAAANPQAILALLDERDHWQTNAIANGREAVAAERRVAALEEGLRLLLAAWDAPLAEGTPDALGAAIDKARALLAAAPSEPAWYTVRGHGVADGGNYPAALPADSKRDQP